MKRVFWKYPTQISGDSHSCLFGNKNPVLDINTFNSLGEYALAAELYREVLRSSEEHKEKLKTDSLQVSIRSDWKAFLK